MAYWHDPAGNIVEIEVTAVDGSTRRYQTWVGDMNPVERLVYADGTVAVTYDSMGRPSEFDVGSDTVAVRYDELGGLEWVSQPPSQRQSWRARE